MSHKDYTNTRTQIQDIMNNSEKDNLQNKSSRSFQIYSNFYFAIVSKDNKCESH